MRVLLLSMPFGALDRPSLGLGLLQAGLRRAGIDCDTAYPSITFAEFTGLQDYGWVSGGLPHTAFAGEWLWTQALYGTRPDADAAYGSEILGGTWQLDDADVRRLLRIRGWCGPLIEDTLARYAWDDYDVVGFTSTFEQNVASLALARRLKEAHPRLRIAFGGANWEGEMGLELARRFPFVDLVCSGEADVSFPAALTASDLRTVPGIVFRDGDEVVATGAGVPITDLDALPWPDYRDFFAARERSGTLAPLTPRLLLETSRGCWWGAKHHCTFCGLNGLGMAYRAKSGDRALAELDGLVGTYGVHVVSAVDNILDMDAFRSFLPRLAARSADGPEIALFYETKANLRHEQLRLLRAAGVESIQPGIESLSDHVLGLLRKGTSALQNVQLLKWCRELGITPEWNVLFGAPGETAADYADMLPLVDAIDFLQPPSGVGPVRLDRFSPYHADPGAFGIVDVRPMAVYRHLYPFVDDDGLSRLAYYFDYAYADGREPLAYAGELVRRVQEWARQGPGPGLWQVAAEDGALALVDQRDGRTFRFTGWQARVYEACDRVRGTAQLAKLAGTDPGEFLAWCREERLLLSIGGRHLALAVHTPARISLPAELAVA